MSRLRKLLMLARGGASGRGSVAAFDPLALQFFARLSSQPTADRAALYNTLIVSLNAAGVWSKLDALYVFAAADAATARTNLISSSFGATAVNSPTFTADEGYAGNGLGGVDTSYIDTNCNSGLTTHYTRDSACFGIWTRVVGDNAGGLQRRHGWLDGDAAVGCYISSFDDGGNAVANVNGAFDNRITTTGGTGLWVGNRSASGAVQLYHDGQSAQTDTTASVAIEAVDFWLGTRNFGDGSNQPSNEQFSAAMIGGSLNATEQEALHAALLAYMQGVGAVA